jgi:hypothetical protein
MADYDIRRELLETLEYQRSSVRSVVEGATGPSRKAQRSVTTKAGQPQRTRTPECQHSRRSGLPVTVTPAREVSARCHRNR